VPVYFIFCRLALVKVGWLGFNGDIVTYRHWSNTTSILSLQHDSFGTGLLLAMWVVAVHAKFYPHLDEPVPMQSVTLLQDGITS